MGLASLALKVLQRLLEGGLALAATRLEIAALQAEARLRALARLWWLAQAALLLALSALALVCAALLLAVDAPARPWVALGLALVCALGALGLALHVRTTIHRPAAQAQSSSQP